MWPLCSGLACGGLPGTVPAAWLGGGAPQGMPAGRPPSRLLDLGGCPAWEGGGAAQGAGGGGAGVS